jgi:ABC-type uncharacterized transport system permease subunit
MKKIIAIFSLTLKNTQVSFGDLLGSMVTYFFRIAAILFFFMFLYKTELGKSPTLAEVSFVSIAWPLVFAQLISVARPRGLPRELQSDLRSGRIGVQMLLPIAYIPFKFFENFSRLILVILAFLPVGLLTGYFLIGQMPEFSWELLLAFPILLLSSVLILLSYLFIATLGFFIEDAASLQWIFSKLEMVFGGNILPIAFMPLWLFTTAQFTPFLHYGYSLGQYLVRQDWVYGFSIIGAQIVWI